MHKTNSPDGRSSVQPVPSHRINNHHLTDLQLFQLCKKYGAQALEARRKFAGLLPEVNRRRLYQKKGYHSIFEFAAKLAGMSHEQVRRVLQLEKRFADKPDLKKALITGEVSANKLVRVVSIATVENQQELVNKAKVLSNRALEVFVKDTKTESKNTLNKSLSDPKTVHVHTNPQESLPDVNLLEHMSLELQKDLIKRFKKGININKLLLALLQKHDREIEQEKTEIAQEIENKQPRNRYAEPSRYIPAKIKKILAKQHGTKCTIPHCNKPARIIHHTQRFSLTGSHNPEYLAPLCNEHHQIAHSIDLKYRRHAYVPQKNLEPSLSRT